MYRCYECGAQYDKKPDYCDCGNDTFEEIIAEGTVDSEENQTESYYGENIFKKNLPSIIFLIICLILSIIILLFVGNPKDEPAQKEEKKIENNKKIPDIDEIWNDEKPKPQVIKKPEIQPKQEQMIIKAQDKKEEKIIQPVIKPKEQKPQQVIVKPQSVVKKNTKPQVNNTPKQSQTTQPVKKTQVNSNTQKPQQTQAPKQTQQTQTNTQKQTQQVQQNQTQQTQKPQPTQQTQSQNIQTKPVEKVNPDELKQYKKALRSKIASNIDFLSVAGDGKCSLSFSISKSGALLNRKFVSQSQNVSLNDAVYSAMLKVSSFKAPPAGYKNETLKLTVQISGGNFAVSLE